MESHRITATDMAWSVMAMETLVRAREEVCVEIYGYLAMTRPTEHVVNEDGPSVEEAVRGYMVGGLEGDWDVGFTGLILSPFRGNAKFGYAYYNLGHLLTLLRSLTHILNDFVTSGPLTTERRTLAARFAEGRETLIDLLGRVHAIRCYPALPAL